VLFGFEPSLLVTVGPNNELHHFENKGLENDGSKNQLHFACWVSDSLLVSQWSFTQSALCLNAYSE
jgi:hypothetical protein